MAVEPQRRLYLRVEDLDRVGAPEKFVELVEGELIIMSRGGKWHNRVAHHVENLFDAHSRAHPELDFGGYNDGFLIRRNPDSLLSPDASLFRRRAQTNTVWMEFAPEIAVEVLSPSNNATEMAFKRQRFFDAGTEQFWLVDPEQRRLTIYHRDGRIQALAGDAVAEGEGIAAGLKISLKEIFLER